MRGALLWAVLFVVKLCAVERTAAAELRGSNCTMPVVPVLYDMPVSNNGARCRIVIYKKNLTLGTDIAIKPPSVCMSVSVRMSVSVHVHIQPPLVFYDYQCVSCRAFSFILDVNWVEISHRQTSCSADTRGAWQDVGGLRSAEYLALNPHGKMPLLVTSHGNIPESDTIARHLLDIFSDQGPSFVPSTMGGRVKSDLLCRLHDMYVTTIQGCMYKPAPPFGVHRSRFKALEDLRQQLLIIDSHVDETGPYIAGSELSLADATVFPTLVFVLKMLPKFTDEWVYATPCLLLRRQSGTRAHQWLTSTHARAECSRSSRHQAVEVVLMGQRHG